MSGILPDSITRLGPSSPNKKRPRALLHRLLRRNSAGINVTPGNDDDGWDSPPPVTLACGSTVRVFKDGEAFRAAYDAIEQAQSRVCFEFYIWDNDSTGRAFAELLMRKSRQGVAVYCIYDGVGVLGGNDRSMFASMRAAGVRVAEFHPIRPWECNFSWKPFSRDHRKLVVVDDKFAGVGGLNVTDVCAGAWVASNDLKISQLWRDTAIGITGPAARHFLVSFVKTWHYLHRGGRIVRAMHAGGIHVPPSMKGNRVGPRRIPVKKKNDCPAAPLMPENSLGVLATVPTLCSPLRPILHKLLRAARFRVRMTMAYFAPDDELVQELCDAARRGVRVELVFGAKSDMRIMTIAARAFYQRMLSAGVKIHERQHVILHAKTMLVDDVSIVGSTNLDYRSIELNCEISAVVRNAAFADQLCLLFDHDVKYSREINHTTWRKRRFIDRAVQWGVIKLRKLL